MQLRSCESIDVFLSFIILPYSQAIYTVLQINLLKRCVSDVGSLQLALTYVEGQGAL